MSHLAEGWPLHWQMWWLLGLLLMCVMHQAGLRAGVLFWLYLACGMKSGMVAAIKPWMVVTPLLLVGRQAAVLFCGLYLELAEGW